MEVPADAAAEDSVEVPEACDSEMGNVECLHLHVGLSFLKTPWPALRESSQGRLFLCKLHALVL